MPEQVAFVTGKLAEPALRRVVAELADAGRLTPHVVVLPITVAALLTTDWVARKLTLPAGIDRVILPGLCRGDLAALEGKFATKFESGPDDLRDLPRYLGRPATPGRDYGDHAIEIIAEVNHAPQLELDELLRQARHYLDSGADVIDLGCTPGVTWPGVGDAVRAVLALGVRVSIDSFNPMEVDAALAAGATLVLSVNSENVRYAADWRGKYDNFEVVAIPDTPDDLASLYATAEVLDRHAVPYRLDPILEPIGLGFAASLVRYHEVRRRFPTAKMMMGVGNVTELTDVDSAGVNVLLAAFCEEFGINSVLTTEVVSWARSSVRELDLARRLVHYANKYRTLPKYVEPRLVTLRDRVLPGRSEAELAEVARTIRDHNYRLFAENGRLHAMNRAGHHCHADPFALFKMLLAADPALDASHAFYLGYEAAKATTALTLTKNYTQDRPLDWGHLTRPEASHHNPGARET